MESVRDGGEHIAHSPTVWTELHPDDGNDLPVAVAVVVGELCPSQAQLNNQGNLRNLAEVISVYGTPYTGPSVHLPFRLHPNAPIVTKIKIGRRLVSWMNERAQSLRFDFGYSSHGTCHAPRWVCTALAHGIETSGTSYTKKEANFVALYDWFGIAKYGFAWNHADIVEQLNGANGEATGWDDLDQPPQGFIHNPDYECMVCREHMCCNDEEREMFPHFARFNYRCQCTSGVCFGCAARAAFTAWLNSDGDLAGYNPASRIGKVTCPGCRKACGTAPVVLVRVLDTATLLTASIHGGERLGERLLAQVNEQLEWRRKQGIGNLTKWGHVGGVYNSAGAPPQPTLPGVKFIPDPHVSPPPPYPNDSSDFHPVYIGAISTIVARSRKRKERREEAAAHREPRPIVGNPYNAPGFQVLSASQPPAPVRAVVARAPVQADAGLGFQQVGEMDADAPAPTTQPRVVNQTPQVPPNTPPSQHTLAQPPPVSQPAEPAPVVVDNTTTRDEVRNARLRRFANQGGSPQLEATATSPGAPEEADGSSDSESSTEAEPIQPAGEDAPRGVVPSVNDSAEESKEDTIPANHETANPTPSGPPATVPETNGNGRVWSDVDTFTQRPTVRGAYGTFGPPAPPLPPRPSLGARISNGISEAANRFMVNLNRAGRLILSTGAPDLPVAAPPPTVQPTTIQPVVVARPANPPGPPAPRPPRGGNGAEPQRDHNDPTLNHRGDRWDVRRQGTLYTVKNDITESMVYRVPSEVHLACMLFVFMSAEQYQWYYLMSIILYGILYTLRKHLNYVGLVVVGLIVHAARGEENANEVWDFVQSMFTTHNRTLLVSMCLVGVLCFYFGLALDLFYFKFNRQNKGRIRLMQRDVVGTPLVYAEIWSRICRLTGTPCEAPDFQPDPKFIGKTEVEYYPNLFEYSYSLRCASKDSEGLMRYIQSDINTLTARADRPLDPMLVLNTVTLVHQAILTSRQHNSYHCVTDEKAVPSIVW